MVTDIEILSEAGMHEQESRDQSTRKPHAESVKTLLESISQATAPVIGDDFFRSLIERLATHMNADTALLTQCPTPDRDVAQTLAFCHRGRFEPNIEFPLAGTPCEHVIHDGKFRFLPEGVSQQFPAWAQDEGGVESFIGVPVTCPDTSKVLGHIAVYDRKPMPRGSVAESMFRIIAMRVSAEILRRQADQARREQQQLAQQRLHELAAVSRRASISEMTSAVTHEIRQPLTQIRTYVQTALRLLNNPDTNPETLRSALEQTLSGAKRGEAIVNRLHQWMGSTEIRSERIETGELIEETGRLLSSELVRIGAVLETAFDDELPALAGDRVLLQQVIFNLMRNSLEAVERAGRIAGEGRIRIRAAGDEAGQLTIEISDTGEGISDALVEDIFRPFSEGADKGMGIGLSLCRSIVESHGGNLKLASARNPTVFRVTLPARRGAFE